MRLRSSRRSTARRVRETLAPVEVTGSARQVYHAMLEQQIAPQLREWGLSGEAQAYEYPSDLWHLRLAFVPASWNSVTRFQFDVNVLAVTKEAWDQWRETEQTLPNEPDATMYYAHDFDSSGGLMSRLGEFQRGQLDLRWTVYDEVDPSATAADVLARIKSRVIPEFRGRAQAPVRPAA